MERYSLTGPLIIQGENRVGWDVVPTSKAQSTESTLWYFLRGVFRESLVASVSDFEVVCWGSVITAADRKRQLYLEEVFSVTSGGGEREGDDCQTAGH